MMPGAAFNRPEFKSTRFVRHLHAKGWKTLMNVERITLDGTWDFQIDPSDGRDVSRDR